LRKNDVNGIVIKYSQDRSAINRALLEHERPVAIDIYRDLVTTLKMNILGYSTVIKYIQEQSFCSQNEDNEIQDQDSPIEEITDAILQALTDESSHQCMN
jgi:hypothetical protein